MLLLVKHTNILNCCVAIFVCFYSVQRAKCLVASVILCAYAQQDYTLGCVGLFTINVNKNKLFSKTHQLMLKMEWEDTRREIGQTYTDKHHKTIQ